MKWEYDQPADALYIRVLEGVPVARTAQVEAGTLVDLDRGGRVIGIEVLRPARPWPVREIVERFQLPDEVARPLLDVWGRPGHAYRLPFATSEAVAAAAD